MRGKVVLKTGELTRPGITPAYAGKSYRQTFVTHCGQDHPRVCGEKVHANLPGDGQLGSPPRMRGKDVPGMILKTGERITPAYAGKSAFSDFG